MQIYLSIMPEWMIKSISIAEPISTKIIDGILTGYNSMRTLFFSYFIINILNFFTITLFYNYLNPKAQPGFSHNFL